MATKLDINRPLYMGKNPVRENTTVDHIRRAVKALDEGDGVPYGRLEEYLLANYTPAKSAGYGSSFIKSYVRDAVNKYDYLTHEGGEDNDYAVLAGAATPRKAGAPKAPRVSKEQAARIEILELIRDKGEVADAGDIDNAKFSLEDLSELTGSRVNTVTKKIQALVTQGYLRTEAVDGNDKDDTIVYVYLTPAGLAAANAADPAGGQSNPDADKPMPTLDPMAESGTKPVEDADEEE